MIIRAGSRFPSKAAWNSVRRLRFAPRLYSLSNLSQHMLLAPPDWVRLTSTRPITGQEGSDPVSGENDIHSEFTSGYGSLDSSFDLAASTAASEGGAIPAIALATSSGPVIGTIQTGLVTLQSFTGLPWWATVIVATIAVRTCMLPMTWVTATHTERYFRSLPELRMLREMLKKALTELPAQDVPGRAVKISMFLSGSRGVMGLHRYHPLGMLSAPLVNTPSFLAFVWALRGMMRSGETAGLDSGGLLWFSDLTASDSTAILPVVAIGVTYMSTEISFGRHVEGWRKMLKSVCQPLIVLSLPIVGTLPQGVFLYWITSSLFTSGQYLAMKDPGVREKLGLKPLPEFGTPPTPQPGGGRRAAEDAHPQGEKKKTQGPLRQD